MLPALQIRDVCRRWLAARTGACNKPLAKFKANGGVKDDGTLSWRGPGQYQPVFDGDDVTGIKFVGNGDTVSVSKGWFDKAKGIRFNWSIWRAFYHDEPLPEVKLHLLFKKDLSGPYKTTATELHQKSKGYIDTVQAAFDAWKADKDKTGENEEALGTASAVKLARDQAACEAKRKIMTTAREKGKDALKRRRLTSQTKFDDHT